MLMALDRRIEARALLEADKCTFSHEASTLANLGYFFEHEPASGTSPRVL